MAARSFMRLWSRFGARSGTRWFGAAAPAAGTATRLGSKLLLGAVGASAFAYAAHKYATDDSVISTAYAAEKPEAQNSVFSQGKNHAAYVWIHLKPGADVKKCAHVAANIQRIVDHVVPPKESDEDEEIWAGVGFGPNFYHRAYGSSAPEDYGYIERKGANGGMPATGGDIFLHAKSNSVSNLFDLAKKFMEAFPEDNVEKFDDVYSFTYRFGKDLTGFIDGTENPAAEEDRQAVAVDDHGGSYVITQRWIHQFDVIKKASVDRQEAWIGRNKPDSTELRNKLKSSHVARIVGGTEFARPKPFQIVRQSMPYGSLSGDAGLFFIGYAASPKNFNYMLDRMVGADDGIADGVMMMTKCVSGTYWYFPSKNDLKKLA